MAEPRLTADDVCDDADPQAATVRARSATVAPAEALISARRAGEAWWCRIRLTP
jgi:hypothetical protein